MLGEHKPTGGRILFDGADITDLKPFARIRRGISVKFQVPGIFKALSVRQNLEIALQHHLSGHSMREEIDRLLDFIDLTDAAGTWPATCRTASSSGWRSAWRSASSPGSCCSTNRRPACRRRKPARPARWSSSLRRRGMTILAVEHDMEFVRQIARRVTVLHFGEIFAQGSIDEIMANDGVAEIYLGKADGA